MASFAAVGLDLMVYVVHKHASLWIFQGYTLIYLIVPNNCLIL